MVILRYTYVCTCVLRVGKRVRGGGAGYLSKMIRAYSGCLFENCTFVCVSAYESVANKFVCRERCVGELEPRAFEPVCAISFNRLVFFFFHLFILYRSYLYRRNKYNVGVYISYTHPHRLIKRE